MGIDTDKNTPAAYAVDEVGRLMVVETFANHRRGHELLRDWLMS